MASDGRSSAAGLFSSAGGLVAGVLRLVGVRVSFALLELADARDALLRVLLFGALALGFALLGLACLSALAIVLLWEALGWHILLILAVVYATLAAWLLQRALRLVAEGRLGLPVTLAELQKDRAAIFGESAGDGEAQ